LTDSTTAPADPTDHVPQDDAGASASPNAAEQPHASAEAGEGPGGAATGTEPAADLLAGDAGDAKPAKRPRAARGTAATRKAAAGTTRKASAETTRKTAKRTTRAAKDDAAAAGADATGTGDAAAAAVSSTAEPAATTDDAAPAASTDDAATASPRARRAAGTGTPRTRKPRRGTTGTEDAAGGRVAQSALPLDATREAAAELPSGPVASSSEAPLAAPSEASAATEAPADERAPDATMTDAAVAGVDAAPTPSADATDAVAPTGDAPLAAEPAAFTGTTPVTEAPPATDTATPPPSDLTPAPIEPSATAAADAPAAVEPIAADAPAQPIDADAAAEQDDEAPAEPPRPVFADLGLSDPVLRAIADMGYRHPTPIQEQAIPYVLMGRDVMGVAQTGTGKTAGFTLPMLDILAGSRARARMPRSLILEPTRELALQVAENFVQYGKYLKLTHALIIGGESMSDQKDVLMRGVDVLIATPGRLIDMFERGSMLLTDTRILVIDEADRMLDMGFIPDVERIVSLLPRNRQTLFFSATMGPEIRRLADAFLQDPKQISVSRPASVATTITEGLVLVAEHDKREALRRLIRTEKVQNALIFCNRKRDVDILYKSLTKHRFSAGALHGDMAQSVRFSTLERFKAGALQLLVCSDVAARGIDIGGLSHVFNFDVPHHAEDYVHRIGRTGRAGLQGHAFTISQPEDRLAVEAIEKLIGHPIPPVVVEGLDPVDWAEDDGRRRRGRGGAKRKPEGRGAPERGARERRDDERGAHDRGPRPHHDRGPRPDHDRAPQPERTARAPEGEPAPAPARERDADRDRRRRDEPRRSEGRRDEFRREDGRRDEPRRDDSRRNEARRDEPRRDDTRRSDSRRDDGRRDRGRREEDLGPAVLGFGDDVPAFMQLPFRSRRPMHDTETEA